MSLAVSDLGDVPDATPSSSPVELLWGEVGLQTDSDGTTGSILRPCRHDLRSKARIARSRAASAVCTTTGTTSPRDHESSISSSNSAIAHGAMRGDARGDAAGGSEDPLGDFAGAGASGNKAIPLWLRNFNKLGAGSAQASGANCEAVAGATGAGRCTRGVIFALLSTSTGDAPVERPVFLRIKSLRAVVSKRNFSNSCAAGGEAARWRRRGPSGVATAACAAGAHTSAA